MKYLRIHNVSIHINIYQNRFINECVPVQTERRKDGVFLWDVEEHTFLINFLGNFSTYKCFSLNLF